MFAFSVLVASMLVFAVMSILPGDPATVMLGTQATPDAVASLREELGLNRPIPVQYLDWLQGAVRGDFGTSVFTGPGHRSPDLEPTSDHYSAGGDRDDVHRVDLVPARGLRGC